MIATPIRALPFLLILIACLAAPGWPQAETIAEWRARAAQGDAKAQYILGGMYDKGHGVPQDYVAAYKWYNLAASRLTGETRQAAVNNRESVAALMTSAQIAEAERAARQWAREHP